MNHFIKYLLLLTIIQTNVFGQDSETFEGGKDVLWEIILGNLIYPTNERDQEVEGIVILKFRTDGNTIDSLEVLNSVSPNIDSVAVRAFYLTNGKWKLKPNEFYLITIAFVLDFPGRKPTKSIKKKRDKSIKRDEFKKALNYLNEIKRREPFDFENLEILKSTYEKLSEPQKMERIIEFKKEIETTIFI